MNEFNLEALKKRVDPLRHTELVYMSLKDSDLLRYLVAFKTVDLAFERLTETNSWRRDNKVNEACITWPGVQKHVSHNVCVFTGKSDNKGRPINYVAVRNHTTTNRNIREATNFLIYQMELMGEQVADFKCESICIVYDMKNFGFNNMDFALVKTLYEFFNRHYPERLGIGLVLNAPVIFYGCWTIIKQWLDERTRKKIEFVDMEQLREYLDPDILPLDI